MSLQMLKPVPNSLVPVLVTLLFVTSTAWGQSTGTASLRGHQVVVLLDINPHQKEVLPIELSLAQGVIQKLDREGYTFSAITFGSTSLSLLKSSGAADQAITAIREVTLEERREKYFSIRFYDAIDLGISQLVDDNRPKTLLIISEGNDYFPRKTFKKTVSRAQ